MSGELVRLRIDIAYDGAPFSGWASQPSLPTVQGAVEAALELVIRRPVRTVVAGRTDTGVHARRQTVHVDVPVAAWESVARRGGATPGEALVRRLNGALNRVLGKDRLSQGLTPALGAIVVHDAAAAPAGFDARFSALSRSYAYRISDHAGGHDPLTRGFAWWVNDELNVPAMNSAVTHLLGLNDFLSFCKPREGATTIRELQSASVQRDASGLVVVRLTADAFCHHMVRSVVGAATRVGRGSYGRDWLGERLEARVRDARVLLAPPHGLVLESVEYPADHELAARAERTRAKRLQG
ncbi:tRNA pseudouridine(38-40) synthase TruA [Kocuria sp. cx-455]|uniref:tRNA pseudouridine(38-40) synthase TruA n=1 Tax=Kocuria sp. cx-455 TaxID=2771377 RepID=UPI00168937E0|nr:tRNA pseudouridine(38-40) synthase TruA [Kocuria sp. cx-455]MBD2764361.1 tRNA pseudouridine(38-40) synthase TruA [Kocuria sp. cx-455]